MTLSHARDFGRLNGRVAFRDDVDLNSPTSTLLFDTSSMLNWITNVIYDNRVLSIGTNGADIWCATASSVW